jgi:DNA/RNA endonuclease YhcR with UshA esterase domain
VIAGRDQQGGPRYGDQDGVGALGPGRVMIAASEEVSFENGNTANIIVTGAVMQSDFEVREPDNAAQLPNSNFTISRNIIRTIAPQPVITDIAEARTLPHGTNVVVEGIVTSNVNANNNEINTGFFDSIYVQDATGGINLFPVASGVAVGQKVRVSGSISEFQGETQISVARIEVIDAAINEVLPTKVTTAEAMNPDFTGMLVNLTGRVSDVRIASNGSVTQFTVTDASGVGAVIFINAYITTIVDISFVQAGAFVSVTGLASIGETDDSNQGQPRIRVRDRNEITLAESSGLIKSASNARFINIAETSKNSRVWVLTFNALVEYTDGSREIKTYSINLRGNNANLDGRYIFIAGHDLAGMTLVYDIKGNGSNIKMFELRP